MAIEVFPVCLSPTINSLCPLPIGTKASIAFIPVSNGVRTKSLSIIGGASFSTG